MTSNQTIHPALVRAYREAKYVIECCDPITLRIGQANPSLKKLLADSKVQTAAFITAFNPFSQIKYQDENLAAQALLLQDISRLGFSVINGYGQDDKEEWPREASYLILGITESQAEPLADKCGQNAFVWIGSVDAFAALRLRHPIGLPTSGDYAIWLSSLPTNLATAADKLNAREQAWLMTVSTVEQAHWLNPDSWDLNKSWPLAKPDGSAMGIGTELDRVFKLIAAGQSSIGQ